MSRLTATSLFALSLLSVGFTQGQGRRDRSPFAPPNASLHYALDRTCDLQHVAIDVDVDYENRTIKGKTVNTLSPLRSGLREVMLMARLPLQINSVLVNGVPAKHRREGKNLFIEVRPTVKGRPFDVTIAYQVQNSKAQPFGGAGGFHWIEASKTNPTHVGFWTQGESEFNSQWAPTWDYPNDLTTSETRCTVPADWDMIGNGVLVDTKLSADKKRKTFHWRMNQPHATYLLTMVGGPFDIKRDKWEGVDLLYVTPRGEGTMIDDSFGHTKDMLSFYSKILSVKYPWPKYAQLAVYDFGGGMENVSATTLGEGSLTEARDGWFRMDSLNSHELGHQWFGDLVTCKDWSDTWLNESFATYMQCMYFEHSRGPVGYDWEIDDAMRAYFAESRQYKRPISTKMYPNADAMFDSHTYPKGGVVLHTLRRFLGDESFFSGLNYYLTKWRHTPVESGQLRRAFTEASGINTEPFWAQWLEKPGHPVLDYAWTADGNKVKLTVTQKQDTTDGTPTYDIYTFVDFISENNVHTLMPVHLSKTEETFEFTAPTGFKAVVLDPKHDFLREIPKLHWSEAELPWILRGALNAPDRAEAIRRLAENPTPENLKLIEAAIAGDSGMTLVFRNVSFVGNLAKPELRSLWLSQLKHVNFDRRAAAVSALGKLPADPATIKALRSLVTEKDPIAVVVNAIDALAEWDPKGNLDVFRKALTIKDRRGRIAAAAKRAIGE